MKRTALFVISMLVVVFAAAALAAESNPLSDPAGAVAAGAPAIDSSSPPTIIRLDVRHANTEVVSGQLQLGGKNSLGDSIEFNNRYMLRNGQAVLPVIGEFHYIRTPPDDWDRELKKMRAGGVNIVSTYVFWNCHEEVEGQFDWTGQRDLRKFIERCAENGLDAIVRIGPFDHGEIRNGGLPDWLYGRPFNVRSNDPAYLRLVQRLYGEIGKQLSGLLFKDGGPVIGIQIENELHHSAAPWALSYPGQSPEWTNADEHRYFVAPKADGKNSADSYAEEGRKHMAKLKQLAIEAGMEVPLYTATGWGNAAIIDGGCIPVTSAYPYPTWDPPSPSPLFLFKDLRLHPDYAPVSYQPDRYPVFGAELGGGIMNTYSRRPTVSARSLDALIVRQLGSGANAVGYYMFHGGSTPRGRNSFLSDEAAGVPKISYDFQAPLGEFGQPAESFGSLKPIHYFLNDFGATLAPMATVLPDSATKSRPADVDQLRLAARVKGDSGFLFLHNFQDHVATHDLTNLKLAIQTASDEIQLPRIGTMTLKSEAAAILPFNIDFGGASIVSATAQPMADLSSAEQPRYAWMAIDGIAPEFVVATKNSERVKSKDCQIDQLSDATVVRCKTDTVNEFEVDRQQDKPVIFVVFPQSMARQAWLIKTHNEKRLIFTGATVLPVTDEALELHSHGSDQLALSVYPTLTKAPRSETESIESVGPPHPSMSAYQFSLPKIEPFVHAKVVDRKTITLSSELAALPDNLNDVLLEIDYIGDIGQAFMNGQLVDDHFYFGQPWQLGLRRFFPKLAEEGMYFSFHPLTKDAPFLADLPAAAVPDFSKQHEVLRIDHVRVISEYRLRLQLE
ncbi:MAG TPA: beta-galactosidase [Pirellulales bacterium]